MSASNPRWYKWYPTEETDLGTMPFDGDWTVNDRIVQMDASGMQKIYVSNATGTEFGQFVKVKVGGRIKTVWQAGVTVRPVTMINPYTQEEVQAPVWFMYCGDGLCVVKLPEGETIEPVET